MVRRLPVWERDVADATSVTTKGNGHQFEIQLGHLCNERCVFCSSGQLSAMKLARAIPLAPIVDALERARQGGARRVTFLGGEPTLHKGFVHALERAVALGFEEIVIFTNGVMLPHPGFIEKIAALGTFEWRISIQGGNEAAHVAVTKRKDSFARIVKGLGLLRARGQKVTVNVCVNELSYRSLPDYPALVREHGIRQLHVDIVRPSSTGMRTEEYLRDIMPRYSVMAPALSEMLTRFEAEDPEFDVNVGNLPFCILPSWADRIHHGGEETITQASSSDALEVEVDKYAWHVSQRRHVPACADCALRSQCTGVFKEYLELYGDDEFQPVSRDTLRRAGQAFTTLVLPLLAPVLEGPLPDGFTREAPRPDRRARRITARLRTPAGAQIVLAFDPNGRRPAPSDGETFGELPVLVTDAYELRVAVGAAAPAEVNRLLRWVADALSTAEGVSVVEPLDVSRAVERLLAPQALLRGQARMRRIVGRIERQRRFDTFVHAETRLEEDGAGCVVRLVARGGGSIDIVLTIGTRAGRSQVSLDVQLGEGTEVEVARPAVDELLAMLGAGGDVGPSTTGRAT